MPAPHDVPCPVLPASFAGRVGNHPCQIHLPRGSL
jgi:hypothetical protein